jgi:putative ABC transport system substrate-binding protein
MIRRRFLSLAGAAVLATPRGVAAQDAASRPYRVGALGPGPPLQASPNFEPALMRGLARRGYVPGRNLEMVDRGFDMDAARLPGLLAELEAAKPEVVVAFGYTVAIAAKQGTSLPVVSFSTGDPVGIGLVDSLARPGGHVTGISDVSEEITPKRLELLTEMAPGLHRVAALYNASDPGMTLRYRAFEAGAKALGVSVQPLGVREPDDFDEAFKAMDGNMPDAILMVSDPLTNLNRRRVFAFALAHRLPAIYENEQYVREGGLMSYGPDVDESLDRVAALVDRILKGAKAADLPFEQPTLFRFVINLTAAKAIGVTVPPLLIARADEVIE